MIQFFRLECQVTVKNNIYEYEYFGYTNIWHSTRQEITSNEYDRLLDESKLYRRIHGMWIHKDHPMFDAIAENRF